MTETTGMVETPETTVVQSGAVYLTGNGTALTAEQAGAMARQEIEVAKARAEVAAEVIEENHLYKVIGGTRNKPGKKYVFVDGWTTLARLYNYVPDIEGTEPLEGVEGKGYVAHARLIDAAGQVVSRAEASATTTESRWSAADDYALRSMAQTRAISKVCRVALSWVMVLAGFQGTPAEEMPGDKGPTRQPKVTDLKARQAILSGLVKDRIDNDGWDDTAKVLNAIHDGSMTMLAGKWKLRWDAIGKDGMEELITALTPEPEPAQEMLTEQAAELPALPKD